MRPVRHFVFRAILALLALVTAAAPAAAAVGEGVLASRAGRSAVVVHIEDGRRAQCPYVHTDDCVLCGAIGVHALPTTVGASDETRLVHCHVVDLPDAATWPASGSLSTRHARGPPTS